MVAHLYYTGCRVVRGRGKIYNARSRDSEAIHATRPVGSIPAIGLTGASTTSAQTYRAKPTRYIIPFALGGGEDLVGRALAPRMADGLVQQVLIDSRPGGGTLLGAEHALYAPIIQNRA